MKPLQKFLLLLLSLVVTAVSRLLANKVVDGEARQWLLLARRNVGILLRLVSPNELLRRLRLRRASSLLATTDKSVSEVAYEVGFSSPSYFAKRYREEFGVSPTEKRNGA